MQRIRIILGLYFWGDDYTDYTFDYTDYTWKNVGLIIRDYTWSVFFMIIRIVRALFMQIILLVMDYSDCSGLYVIIFFRNDYMDYA